MPISATDLNKAYLAYFGRPADLTGKTYFATLEQADVIKAFDASAESKAVYGDNVASKVNAIYQNLFNRDAEPEGLVYWTTLINQGRVTAAGAALAILNGAQGTDTTAVTNKLAASEAFVAALNTTPELVGYSGMEAAASARSWLKAVGADAASLTAAIAGVDAAVTAAVAVGGVPGATFTITTGVDTLVGTAGNDTFIADATVNAVISAADSVNGGAGSDTLKVYLKSDGTVAVDTLSLPQLTSVENLYINSGKLTTAKTLNVSTVAGLESVALDTPVALADTEAFTIKTTAAQNVSLKNVTGATDANFTLTLDGAVKATLDGVKGAGAGVATLDVKAETAAFALNATGAASAVTLTNTAAVTKLATLNITGDKAVTVTEALTTLKTVNASANTGGVTLNVGATAVDLAFTGGAGNDKVVIAGAQLNAKDALIGGAGTDTIVLADTTVGYAGINAATGFEVLGLGVTATTVDVGQITNGINQFAINANKVGTFDATFQNALSTSKFSINNDAGNGTITIGNKVGESATTVAIDNQSAASQTITKLDVSGETSVALASTGKVGSTNVITTLANADNSNIVVTGATDLTITNALAGVTTGTKFDASAFTGKLTVIGSAKNDIIIGGSGDDTITGGNGADTLTGGAGKDKFVVTQTAAAVTAAAQADVITDFVTKSDSISFGDAAGSVTNYKEATAAVADFATALAAADAVFNADATVTYSVQQVGADSYVFYALAASTASEQVVKLTGVALTAVELADIVA